MLIVLYGSEQAKVQYDNILSATKSVFGVYSSQVPSTRSALTQDQPASSSSNPIEDV